MSNGPAATSGRSHFPGLDFARLSSRGAMPATIEKTSSGRQARFMQPSFDLAAAHKYFSAGCFNRAWSLIDQAERTADENELMLALAHASVWHWRERDDCQPRNLSIGYWQLSRVYSLIRHGERAAHYGELCLAASVNEPPFFQAYAHEAIARAAALTGDVTVLSDHIAQARRLAEMVREAEDRQLLLADLETISLLIA